nr:MAG TPA: Portal protein [Caudoviricetes sp.]
MKKNKELRKAETDKKNNQFGQNEQKDTKAEQKNQQTAQNDRKAEQNAPKAEQTPNRQQREQNGQQRESQPREQRRQTEPNREQQTEQRQPNEQREQQNGEYRPERYRPKENKEQTEPQQSAPTEPHFSPDKVSEVLQILHEYKDGKTTVDMKATENQEWWRLRHWNVIQGKTEAGKAKVEVGSAWAVNSILNKHADFMDSFPKANVLAREADDEEEAQILSKILPAIEEHTDAEQVYNTAGYDFLIDGTAITSVLWDPMAHDGMGDIKKTNVDIHNVFWQPGIEDIQQSKYFFDVSVADVNDVKLQYPDIADRIGGGKQGFITEYIHDDNINHQNDIEIINCYYKKLEMRPVLINIDPQTVAQHLVPREILHMAIIIGDQCVFCSEDNPEYQDGFYKHGKYPYVFRKCFPVKDSPCGFGYLDIMKYPQRDIDKLDQAIMKNTMMKAKPRWWVKKNADINKEAFADWNEEIVEVGSGDLGSAVQQMDVDTLPAIVETHLEAKIDELKEISGNRDFSQGSTASGVTAASAIAALQEAGSKLSRDINKAMYRGSREEYYLEIELIRQFYTEPRTFRIDDGSGRYEYMDYSNVNIAPQDITTPEGTRHKKSIFDLEVSAEKQSPFSRASQNETAKELYQMGLFAPDNATSALVCLDMMEFEGKEKIKQQIQQNDTFMQQFQQMQQLIIQLSPEAAVQMGLVDPNQVMMAQNANNGATGASEEGTAEDRAAKKTTNTDRLDRARETARSASEVK